MEKRGPSEGEIVFLSEKYGKKLAELREKTSIEEYGVVFEDWMVFREGIESSRLYELAKDAFEKSYNRRLKPRASEEKAVKVKAARFARAVFLLDIPELFQQKRIMRNAWREFLGQYKDNRTLWRIAIDTYIETYQEEEKKTRSGS